MTECTFTCEKVNFIPWLKCAFTFIMAFKQGVPKQNEIVQTHLVKPLESGNEDRWEIYE